MGRKKGYKHSIETRLKIAESHKGIKYTDEAKRKMSDSQIGKKKSQETIQKMIKSRTGEKNHMYKHGMSKTPEYRTWNGMKQRCYNENTPKYKYYGGRNISVCDRWINSFPTFYEDMGERPEPKLKYSIDRIDPFGNYEPSNCRWSTRSVQQNNKRK